jgi:NAD(P)-dependent dehydrogenase (short-subunit alcohol dehydrogenase family)
LVVGGTSSIGAAVVTRLSSAGSQVAFTGTNEKKGSRLAQATSSQFLLTENLAEHEINKTVAVAQDKLGTIDGLVLAIGTQQAARLSETSDAVWDATFAVNLLAPFLFTKACLPILAEARGAAVLIGSGTSNWPELELGAYSVSKRALACMTQMLAVEGAKFNVRFNCVLPGELRNSSMSQVSSPLRIIGTTPLPPLGRKIEPEDIVPVVEFLLSAGAGQCTGAILMVDGGLRAALRAYKVRQ